MIVNIKIPKLIPPIINEQNKNENKRRWIDGFDN